MVISAHTPNFLPGCSVLDKVAASDAVLWLDEVQFTHGGWSNRNRMPDGAWLTVPVDRATDMAPFNRVRISEHGAWRRAAAKTLHQHYGACVAELVAELTHPYRTLIGLNLALLRVLCRDAEIATTWHFQSHLDGGHAVVAVSDDREELAPISERLAMMVAEVGGDVYISGPSGRAYLDETPFLERDLTVAYWEHSGQNRCAVERLLPQQVAA